MAPTPDSATLRAALERHFGFSEFRPLQQEIITTLLEGRDAFVLMPTGGGKSLCFQLPALLKPGVTVVVSPLIALMKDQVDALTENGVAATFINSSLTGMEIAERRRRLVAGEVRLLYVAPERFTHEFWRFLQGIDLALFAIDEAHCISEWGHDFRPDYRMLSRLRERFPAVPIVAMTATATARVQEDIVQQLALAPETQRFIASFDRPNLFYEVRAKAGGAEQVLDIVGRHRGESGIVYCGTRDRTEQLAESLEHAGFRALPYHAGLEAAERSRNQERFVRDDVEIICATIAFGMGIDKPDVRFVVHYDLPKNLMSYYQETGRAGRDGLPSECVLLYSPGDRVRISRFIDEITDPTERAFAVEQLNQMTQYAESTLCRRRTLLKHFGETYGSDNCNTCDNCTDDEAHETYDATQSAQMLLSCVVRLRESFGLGHVTDVLRGSENARLLNYRHNLLPTYGIGRDLSKEEWRVLGNTLVREGLLRQDAEQHNVLRLTESGRAFLRERRQLALRRPRILPSKKATTHKAIDLPPLNHELFETLRRVRRSIADRHGVPPYVIFGDRTLVAMASQLPRGLSALSRIEGVGSHKLTQYGDEFAAAIENFLVAHGDTRPVASASPNGAVHRSRASRTQRDASTTMDVTLRHYREGLSIEEIAQRRGLSPSTVAGHIEELVATGEITDIERLVDRGRIADIEAALDELGEGPLRPVREKLGEEYSYREIRLVKARREGRGET